LSQLILILAHTVFKLKHILSEMMEIFHHTR